VACEVEFTDEFELWWNSLTIAEQESVAHSVKILIDQGVNLRRPFADTIRGSVFPNMRELRCQHEGQPYRVLYAFDPRRKAMLLIGGNKTGNARWYEAYVPKADRIFAQHLKEIGE